jgi:hypothetical protein
MARISLVLDKAGIRTDATLMSFEDVRRVTRRTLNRSAILCPVRTGRLRASGRMKFRVGARGPTGIVEYPVSYAAAVHDGSGPHVIRARKKKALKFEYNGRTVIVKSVNHPGSPGRPFLRQAAEEVASAEGFQFRRQTR